MLKRWEFTVLTLLGVLALLLVIGNAWLFGANRGAQQEVTGRQQYLQQSAQLETLYREIVKTLAEMAVRNNDAPIIQLLASQGINVTVNAPAAAASSPAAAKR